MRRVIKFGGTSIKNAARIRMAAKAIAKQVNAGNQILVVVSAMGDTTNRLMKQGRGAWADAPFDHNFLRLLATGESQSAPLMAMALGAEGVPAVAIGFDHPLWPVVAVSGQAGVQCLSSGKVNDPVDVRLDDDESQARFAALIEPLLAAGTIPVFPGFFIREAEGGLVSLGRGGSDVSAFLVGRYALADEVVIVSDVKGVMSADPRVVKDSRVLTQMSASLLSAVSHRGAQVLHPNALRYKPDSVEARVVHFRDLGRMGAGTRITGVAMTSLTLYPEALTQVLLFGKSLGSKPGILGGVGGYLSSRGISIHSLTSSDTVMGLYLDAARAAEIIEDLHREFVGSGKAFTELLTTGPVGELTLSNPAFVTVQGVISAISDTLLRNRINIVEMVTSHADIVIYLGKQDAPKAKELLESRLGLGNGRGVNVTNGTLKTHRE
jgi:aspartate kinase